MLCEVAVTGVDGTIFCSLFFCLVCFVACFVFSKKH